jgi:hypothetical protein
VNTSALVPDKPFKCPFSKPSLLGPCLGRNSQAESITFPAGTPVCASLVNHALDENVWAEPEVFKPYERSLWGSDSRFCGFNGVGDKGPRLCPGRDVALELMITALQVVYSPGTKYAEHLTFWSRAEKNAKGLVLGVQNAASEAAFEAAYDTLASNNKQDPLAGKLDDAAKAWTALVRAIRHSNPAARPASTIKHFTKMETLACKVIELRKAPLLHLRLAEVDEDESPFTSGFVQFISSAILATAQHVIDDQQELHYYENNEVAKRAGKHTFGSALPTSEVIWDLDEAETSRGLSLLVFQGLGQAYLTSVKSPYAKDLSPQPGYEMDLSFLEAYGVRKGYEKYGATAFFDSNKQPVGIWWCHGNKMILPSGDKAEWRHAMAAVRSALCLSITAKDHLAFIHMIVANGVHLAMRETLSPNHPLRRLLKPHCFHTTTINLSASAALLPVNGLSYDGFGLDADNYVKAFTDCMGLWKYETFPAFVNGKGLSAADTDNCPFYKDGLEFWNIVHQYVDNYLSLFYPNQTADVVSDVEVMAYWNHFSGPNQLGTQSYGLGELSYPALVDQVTHFIFYVTAGHEFYGSIVEYLLGPNVLPPKLAVGQNVSDLQTFHLALALISLTGNKMPALINSWEHLHSYLLEEKDHVPCPTVKSMGMDGRRAVHSRVLQVLAGFKSELERQAEVVDQRNIERLKDSSKKAFNSCNPKFLECSVSV